MRKGGFRAVALGVLLLTVGFGPTSTSAQICVDPGPAEVCVDDPLRHDAGEASLDDGDVSAHANGGIVTGAGQATFVLDAVADPGDLASDEEVRFDARLFIRDSEGSLVAVEVLHETLGPGDTLDEQLEATVDTVAPLVEGGSVSVQASATLVTNTARSSLGEAQSMSPITFAVAPPQDAADHTTVNDTAQVGQFEAGPDGAFAQAVDGELFVAQDTGLRFEASGTLSSESFNDVSSLRQFTSARLMLRTSEDIYSASVAPIDEFCNTTCSTTAQTVPVELSVVLPGELVDPQRDVRVVVDADWNLFRPTFDGNSAIDSGENDVVALSP